jgi:hypothetical protein
LKIAIKHLYLSFKSILGELMITLPFFDKGRATTEVQKEEKHGEEEDDYWEK